MGQEICLIIGQVSLSLLYWKKKLLTDILGPGEINEKTADIQARSFMARTLEINGKACQAEGEAEVVYAKLYLENARKLRGIYFIDPEDTEFKETIKNARNKLETSMAAAMPYKIMKNCGSGASNKIKKQNLRVFWKLMNPQECVWEIRYRIIMKTILQENGDNSLQHYNLVLKFIPMPQAMKIPAAKAAVDKEWETLEKISAWNLTKVKSKKQVIDEARTSGAAVHFASLMDICHLKNAELETKAPEIQRSSCAPR